MWSQHDCPLVDPAREPGKTSIPEPFFNLLSLLTGDASKVLMHLARHSLGNGQIETTRSLQMICAATGLSKATVISAIQKLTRFGVIASKAWALGQDANTYRFREIKDWDWPTIDRLYDESEARNEHATRMRADSHWQTLRRTVFECDGYTCQYCGTFCEAPVCDHMVPVSQGGINALENLVTACSACNQSKHAKTPEEWARWIAERQATR